MSSKKWFGAHVSASGGASFAIERALELEATAFALFTKNQRQWQAPQLSVENAQSFKEHLRAANFSPAQVLPHGSYLINLGSPNETVRERSLDALCDELMRIKALGLTALNIHPGSSLGAMSDLECLHQIARLITQALTRVSKVSIVLENTAGQGSCVGHRLEHLAEIIAQIPSELRVRVGVCLDTCHAFAAGYALNTPSECEEFFELFEKILGWELLHGMHLNDSKAVLGSRVDRHETLGNGHIGKTLFSIIARDPRFSNIPLILETPKPELWKEEIAWLRAESLAKP